MISIKNNTIKFLTIIRGVRPFGVSLLLAGYDDNGPQLYQVDPSGSYWGWKASAIGKNMLNAKTFLEKRLVVDFVHKTYVGCKLIGIVLFLFSDTMKALNWKMQFILLF